jgi:hypothetical protein
MENIGIFHGHLEYFTVIWYTLLPFGKFSGRLVYFPRFGLFNREKSGNPVPRWQVEDLNNAEIK